jgi:prevent-host-death family protein
MLIVSIRQAKTQMSRLLEAAKAGEDVIIACAGKPVAKLVATDSARRPRELGRLAGMLRVPENFDDPLPDDILALFEGRGE